MSIQQTLSILSNETCRHILEFIKDEKKAAGDIAEALQMSPAALSYHLNRLKKAELIYETKYKNFIYYEADLTVLNDVLLWMKNLKGE